MTPGYAPSVRIASLIPSGTEIVCALGALPELVGRSHECDHPSDVRAVPVLTHTRLDPMRSGVEIDADVRDLLERALALYAIDLEALSLARPDVIVTQDLCDVCAVSFDDVCRATASVFGANVGVVSLRPDRLSAIWEDVRRVGRAIQRTDEGGELARVLSERTAEIARRVPADVRRPTVLSVEWLAPVMIGGLWMPELIELAGGTALVTRAGERAPTLGLDELRALDPDIVLVKPCGFDLEKTLTERRLLAECLPWSSFRSAREGRVFVADGNAYFNRSGPRIVESLEILAACTHPKTFSDLARKHRASMRRLTPELRDVFV
jgi:iron complex transport system substrate-binding protein